ncbi:hypothetical protein KIPB_009498, partial [Kipferlia bialata]|eukprot:g9498.t1
MAKKVKGQSRGGTRIQRIATPVSAVAP